jgi:tetratricopeptide (TPR) repeat protein
VSTVKDNIGNLIKYGGIIALLLVVGYFASEFPKSSSIDFTNIRNKLAAGVFNEPPPPSQVATSTADPAQAERQQHIDTTRAREYLESATNDYYHGSYEEALRRLDRAKIYDPTNYTIFKLSGQIFFEKNKFRKAFNNWERAAQLPHNDRTISRDVDVLKRLLRYSRNEVDQLQRTLNKDPNNRLVRARLKELEEQLRE